MKFSLILSSFALLLLNCLGQKNVTYDTTAKQVYPTNLWFLNPSTPTVPVAGTNIVNKDYVDSVASGLAPFSYNAALTTGTNVYFNPGKLVFRDGTVLSFAGGSVACIASRTNYVGVSLFDGTLRAWRQSYDDGTVWFAEVVTDASSITRVQQYSTPRIPPGRIERTKAKLAAGLPVKVFVCGSSLVYGSIGSPTNRWLKLLWDGSATVSTYRVTGYATTTVEDRSANSHHMRGNWANLWQSVTGKQIAKYNDNAWVSGPDYATRFDSSNSTVRRAPVFEGADLALVNGSFNSNPDGTYGDKYAFFESTVRELRRRGCEVIVTPDHSSQSSPNSRWDEYYQIKQIADAYGCAFADVASAMDYSYNTGGSPYYDTVHQNDTGHARWADAYRGVLNDYRLETDNSRFEIPAKRVVSFAQTSGWNTNAPGMVDYQFRFIAGSGAYGTTSQPDTNNPSVFIGGNTQSDARITFNTGVFVEFAHPRAMGLDIVLDAIQSFSLEIYTSNRTALVKTVNIDSEGSVPKLVPILSWPEIYNLTSYTGLESSASPWRNLVLQFKCVSGSGAYTNSARILGVAWHTPRTDEIPLDRLQLSGTWNTAANVHGGYVPFALQTSTDADAAAISFNGQGVILTLTADSGTGIVDVTLDGRTYQTGLDLYTANSGFYSLNILPPWSPLASMSGIAQPHTARIALNGRNASGSGTPRLRILSVHNLTQP